MTADVMQLEQKSYWGSNGTNQALYERLHELVPVEGPVTNASRNPALERFREATNLYYDLYNNGGCNTTSDEFRDVFGFAKRQWFYADDDGYMDPEIPYWKDEIVRYERKLERKMDIIIELAGVEQFGAGQ